MLNKDDLELIRLALWSVVEDYKSDSDVTHPQELLDRLKGVEQLFTADETFSEEEVERMCKLERRRGFQDGWYAALDEAKTQFARGLAGALRNSMKPRKENDGGNM